MLIIENAKDNDDLEQQWSMWNQQADDDKRKSDNLCIVKYAMTNLSRYEFLKSKINSTAFESTILNKDNIYINFDKFESGKSNILLITGLSGSGKTTLATKLATENHAELIELDIFEHNASYSDDNLKEAGDLFYEYFTQNLKGKKFRQLSINKEKPNDKEFDEALRDFIHFALSYAKKEPNKDYIFEGVQIYSHMDASEVSNYPLIILGTSIKNSILQRWARAGGRKNDWGYKLSDMPSLIKLYWGDEKMLNELRKSITRSE
jgi:uridine kinase